MPKIGCLLLSGALHPLRAATAPSAALLAGWRLARLHLLVFLVLSSGKAGPRQAILEGFLSIRAALQARTRRIDTIYIQRDKCNGATARLTALARAASVPVRRVAPAVIARHATGHSHGGIIALAGPRRYLDVEALLTDRPSPFIVLLDGLEDPYTFGHAVRALYAAGVDGLVVRPRDWSAVDGILARASAGATELLPTAVADTPAEAVARLRARGLLVACATRDSTAAPVYGTDLAGPLLLVLGGEKRGVSRAVLDGADLLVQIPYHREFPQSLGLAAAATALAFEIMRQRTHNALNEVEGGGKEARRG